MIVENLTEEQIFELFKENILFLNASTSESERLDNEALKKIFQRTHISQTQTGDVIFSERNECDALVLVFKGELGVFVLGEGGDEIKVATVEEGHFCCEAAVTGDKTRSLIVKVTKDGLFGQIPRGDFQDFFVTYPVLARNVIWSVNRRLRNANLEFVRQLAKERDDLQRFNEELDRQVKKKTEELREKDLQLLTMDRTVSTYSLAAGIAHEINNPLSIVKSSIGFLKKAVGKLLGTARYWEDKPVPPELLEDYHDYLAQINFDHLTGALDKKFSVIDRGTERIVQLVNSMKRFAKLDMETVGNVDIHQSIEDIIEILSTQESVPVEFIREFGTLPVMIGNAGEINQCLYEIIKNAAVGTIAEDQETKRIVKITVSYHEKDDQIYIQVVDNAEGMSKAVLKQAFNPFFTTKPVGSGTGIGLSIAESIVRRHGGDINISSEEGEGTTVTITLGRDFS